MNNINTATVNIGFSENGRRLHVNIQSGIYLDIENNNGIPDGFSMNTRYGREIWLDHRHEAGVDEEGYLINAGFYSVKKKAPSNGTLFWRNIDCQHFDTYATDMEVLFLMKADIPYKWNICSIHGEVDETWGDCLTMPANPDDAAGEWLIRIPDGAFLQIWTEDFGYVNILNVNGELTKHLGNPHPNPNAWYKAGIASLVRARTLTGCDTQPGTLPINLPAESEEEQITSVPVRRTAPKIRDVIPITA